MNSNLRIITDCPPHVNIPEQLHMYLKLQNYRASPSKSLQVEVSLDFVQLELTSARFVVHNSTVRISLSSVTSVVL